MPNIDEDIESTRASRAGHTFHDKWAARRALQLVFPNDDLFAIAVEGISATENANLGPEAEDVADLVLYYGNGDNFQDCKRLETVQFKYKVRVEPVTASYLKKTIEKFCDTFIDYQKNFSATDVDKKAAFMFVTNAEFKESLWSAITSVVNGAMPSDKDAEKQARYLKSLCSKQGLSDASRLFSRIKFQAGEKSIDAQNNVLSRTLTAWSAGADAEARSRLLGILDLVQRKAGPSGQGRNLIRREDVLDALNCEPGDLFPAETRFIEVGSVVERSELTLVRNLVKNSVGPVFVHAEGGVGKTVFVQSLAAKMAAEFEIVVFDCFGGGSYRSDHHARHLPKIGLVQIINELASRTLCDLLLPGSDDSGRIVKAACKRLAQAATAIKAQSNRLGLLIIIDAVDNAQLEADYRQEAAFPKLLLSAINEEPIDGVKLLLTARTYRKQGVIAQSKVKEVELGPFTDSEAREYLKERKSDALDVEVAMALIRSGRNARVLSYLVQTWDENLLSKPSDAPITVPEIIAQKCAKITSELRVAGWPDSEITEFFVALSLLPPPIPLKELANALGWSAAQVNTAASDLAPMLEITLQGAIFRDEPTETYVRDTYANGTEAQRTIADRLLASQATSAYAAEAAPHFLVVIKDSDRAFALADSNNFPELQSEFGRRRLTLMRLRAAFRLAVAENDFDRILSLSMRLSQAATVNIRGDEFIRSSPSLAIVLGDADAYRRLFADRTGWRGARSARLTVAHRFADDIEDAQIQCESTIRWINWYSRQSHDERHQDHAGPEVDDFVAVLFQRVTEGAFDVVDRNLAGWNTGFSFSASDELLQKIELYDQVKDTDIFKSLVSFAISEKCTAQTLKLQLLSHYQNLTQQQVKELAKTIKKPAPEDHDKRSKDSARDSYACVVQAALTTLFYSSRASAKKIILHEPHTRLSAYDFGERYGESGAWHPILRSCVLAWSSGRSVSYYDLLPNEVKITKQAKAIETQKELTEFLRGLKAPASAPLGKKPLNKKMKAKFNERQVSEIGEGIKIVRELIGPIEVAILSGKGLSNENVTSFLAIWRNHLSQNTHWQSENAINLLVRTIGFGCVRILLKYSPVISVDQAKIIIELISNTRFIVPGKIVVLNYFARMPLLHEVAGEFAQHIAEQIRQDDNISHRGSSYVQLAASLIPMGVDEARDYYKQGLAQLDQMGGESYDQIYSLLRYAGAQQGGFLKPVLAQRLMNLCQTIIEYDSRKFGWTLFARAAARSIGYPAIAKLVRWHDQDVAELSYALPQLVCFLAKAGNLDPRRAVFFLTILKDHGWWDWRSGDGVSDLLERSNPEDQSLIFQAFFEKLRNEHPFGGWPGLWEGLIDAADKYPSATTNEIRAQIEQLKIEAKREQDEFNSRSNSPNFLGAQATESNEEEIDSIIRELIADCDPSSARSIDIAFKTISEDKRLGYGSWQRFIKELQTACPYPKRLAFLLAVCETTELTLSQSLDLIIERVDVWSNSSAHLSNERKNLAKRLFENKGDEIFEGQHQDIARGIGQLTRLFNDKHFILQLVLRKVAADEVELDGEEWLQLATALCDAASGKAGLDALELLLSGPASRFADEIGEGGLRPEQAINGNEKNFISDVIWHLLGDTDAYVRWAVARGLGTLADLKLTDDLALLLTRFDQEQITALASADQKLSFQNSQQWMLMGLARATLRHGPMLQNLRPSLHLLAKRKDLHVIHKVHIARCLRHLLALKEQDVQLDSLLGEIDQLPHGIVTRDDYPPHVDSISDFHFDYEFTKHEVSSLSRLFNISKAMVKDAIVAEIQRRWPNATSMDYFPGSERHDWQRGERYETYREHVQRHALLNVATSFSKTLPVVIRSYDSSDDCISPWSQWYADYDVTFDDGSWLSDRKDAVPKQAKENFLGKQIGHQETLQEQQSVLRKLGFLDTTADVSIPLFGRWSSPDGVTVSIASALTARTGATGRCITLAKQPNHDLWLPQFWDGGYYDPRGRRENPFSPLIWSPESHGHGIDIQDKIAAAGPLIRPRLGIEITRSLGLVNESNGSDWYTTDGCLALSSQVWGNWTPDPDNGRYHHHEDGEILWASTDWLAGILPFLKQRLVFTVTLLKHKSSRSYALSNGARSTLVILRNDDGSLRIWQAKKASISNY